MFPATLPPISLARQSQSMTMIETLIRLIRERGWTQASFEKMVGLPDDRISKWANGTGEPTVHQALRMAEVLAVTLDELLGDEGARYRVAATLVPGPDPRERLAGHTFRFLRVVTRDEVKPAPPDVIIEQLRLVGRSLHAIVSGREDYRPQAWDRLLDDLASLGPDRLGEAAYIEVEGEEISPPPPKKRPPKGKTK